MCCKWICSWSLFNPRLHHTPPKETESPWNASSVPGNPRDAVIEPRSLNNNYTCSRWRSVGTTTRTSTAARNSLSWCNSTRHGYRYGTACRIAGDESLTWTCGLFNNVGLWPDDRVRLGFARELYTILAENPVKMTSGPSVFTLFSLKSWGKNQNYTQNPSCITQIAHPFI